MEFEGTFETSASRDTVFNFVMEPEKLSSCIPGLKKFEKLSQDEFSVIVRAGIAFIKEDFTIRFKVLESRPPEYAKLSGTGSGKSGTLDIVAEMNLSGEAGKTIMKWRATANVGGKIGSMGQRLITGQAQKIINEMFDGIRSALSGN